MSGRRARDQSEDPRGPAAGKLPASAGMRGIQALVVSDERRAVAEALWHLADQAGDMSLTLTTGGTGLAARDVAPEAAMHVVECTVPGLTEAMRAVAAVRGTCLIANLPADPSRVRRCLEVIRPAPAHACALPHAKPADPLH